jgi:hypothetical protein
MKNQKFVELYFDIENASPEQVEEGFYYTKNVFEKLSPEIQIMTVGVLSRVQKMIGGYKGVSDSEKIGLWHFAVLSILAHSLRHEIEFNSILADDEIPRQRTLFFLEIVTIEKT